MMVDRRHLEHAIMSEFEAADLDDVGHDFDDEQAAQDDRQELGVRGDRQG